MQFVAVHFVVQRSYADAKRVSSLLPVEVAGGEGGPDSRLISRFGCVRECASRGSRWYFCNEVGRQMGRTNRVIRDGDNQSFDLTLGDKNMVMWYYDFTLPAVKKHVDVVCVQAYGPLETDRKLSDMIYEATGKPIFNGDGCFGLAGPNQ